MKWLEDNFGELDEHTTALKNEQYAQAFILRLIGDLLMPDKSQNLVHIRWLLHLVDFKECDQLSWGSAVLATLYRELCWTTKPNKMSIDSWLLLLQSWVWWNFRLSYVGLPKQLKDIQLLLDQRPEAKFEWMSYIDPTIVECILPENLANQNHRNDFILIREPFFTPKMAASAKYMPWFRHHGKSYLLSVEPSSRQIHPRGHDNHPEIL
ncbi:hypothetical protein Goari_012248, partial [Gossypium aridum]|nr:hypothetical protein [Gossypium aridum]